MSLSGITSTSGDGFTFSNGGVSSTGENIPAHRSSQLSEEDRREVEKLKKRDAEVKAHETAHIAAGGQYVRGGASYEYQTGPDGKQYAVGGEVSIDTSAIAGNPQATISKMQTVKRAALAPAQPSGQDETVAAQATAEMMKAQQELAKQQQGSTGSAPHGAKGSSGTPNLEQQRVSPFPKSSESAYLKHSNGSGRNPASGHASSINVTA